MFKSSILPCSSVVFDCKEHNGRHVDGIRLLVNCTLTDITDIDSATTVGWKKDHEHIGHCYTNPVRCYPYNPYGKRFYFRSCGSVCFTLGIKQPMSSDYNGEYHITASSGQTVTEVALIINVTHPDDKSVPMSTILTSSLSLTSKSPETPFIAENNVTTGRPIVTSTTRGVYVNLSATDSSRENITYSQDKSALEHLIILIISIPLASITVISLSLIGHKVYKYKMRYQLTIGVPVTRSINGQGGMGIVALSGSVHDLQRENITRAIISQPQAEQHEPELYQALHCGPMLPPRTGSVSRPRPVSQCSTLAGAAINAVSGGGMGTSVTNLDEECERWSTNTVLRSTEVGIDDHDPTMDPTKAQDIYFSVDECGMETMARDAVENPYVADEASEMNTVYASYNFCCENEDFAIKDKEQIINKRGSDEGKQIISDDFNKNASNDVYYTLEKSDDENEDRGSLHSNSSSVFALYRDDFDEIADGLKENSTASGIELIDNDDSDEIYAKPHRFREPQISQCTMPNLSPSDSDMYSAPLVMEDREYSSLNRPPIEDMACIEDLHGQYADVGYLPVSQEPTSSTLNHPLIGHSLPWVFFRLLG